MLASASEMALPAEPRPTPIAFPKPPDEPPPAKPAPKEAAGGEAAKPAANSAPAVQELLLVVADRKTQQRTIRRIQFEPQRPRRFVQARVGYDLQEQRVRIRVAAPNPAVLPPGVLKVRAEFVEPLEEAAERRLEGELRAPDFATDLYAEIESAPQRIATVQLHVDGYPRAFVYRVPCWAHSVELPEQRDLLDVRVVQLPQGRNYLPDDAVPVRLQIDAPDGAFDRPDDVVEVGVDMDRDRELEGEQVVSLRADRQAAVSAVQFAPGGVLTLDARRRRLPGHLAPGRAAERSRQRHRQDHRRARQRWSNAEPVIFDALPPRATRIELEPDRLVVQGAELSVLSWVSDDDLSGVAKVEAGLDVQRNGQLAAEPKPAAAHLDAAGRWVAKLATADYPPGQYTLLVRATDNLNNSRLVKVRDVRILTEQEAKEEQQKQTNQLAGSVLFGGKPVPEAAVELAPAAKKPAGDAAAKKPDGDAAAKAEPVPAPEAQRTSTNEQGRFSFSQGAPRRLPRFGQGAAAQQDAAGRPGRDHPHAAQAIGTVAVRSLNSWRHVTYATSRPAGQPPRYGFLDVAVPCRVVKCGKRTARSGRRTTGYAGKVSAFLCMQPNTYLKRITRKRQQSGWRRLRPLRVCPCCDYRARHWRRVDCRHLGCVAGSHSRRPWYLRFHGGSHLFGCNSQPCSPTIPGHGTYGFAGRRRCYCDDINGNGLASPRRMLLVPREGNRRFRPFLPTHSQKGPCHRVPNWPDSRLWPG